MYASLIFNKIDSLNSFILFDRWLIFNSFYLLVIILISIGFLPAANKIPHYLQSKHYKQADQGTDKHGCEKSYTREFELDLQF